MNTNILIWIYTALLVAGGLTGFLKAKSKMSLIMSVTFAIPLALCAAGIIKEPIVPDLLVAFLFLFFAFRFSKSKKFMPGGLMTLLSLITLVLLILLK